MGVAHRSVTKIHNEKLTLPNKQKHQQSCEEVISLVV